MIPIFSIRTVIDCLLYVLALKLNKYFSRQLDSAHIEVEFGCLVLSEYGVRYKSESIH